MHPKHSESIPGVRPLIVAGVLMGVTELVAQSVTESVKDELRTFPQDKGSFSLVHRRLNEMSEADRAWLQATQVYS